MRRALALALLVACGKSGDPVLESAATAEVLDIRSSDLVTHVERRGQRFLYKTEPHQHHPTTPKSLESDVEDPARHRDPDPRPRGASRPRVVLVNDPREKRWRADGVYLTPGETSLDGAYAEMETELGIARNRY